MSSAFCFRGCGACFPLGSVGVQGCPVPELGASQLDGPALGARLGRAHAVGAFKCPSRLLAMLATRSSVHPKFPCATRLPACT